LANHPPYIGSLIPRIRQNHQFLAANADLALNTSGNILERTVNQGTEVPRPGHIVSDGVKKIFGEQRKSLPSLLLRQVIHGSGEPPGVFHIEVIANGIDVIVTMCPLPQKLIFRISLRLSVLEIVLLDKREDAAYGYGHLTVNINRRLPIHRIEAPVGIGRIK